MAEHHDLEVLATGDAGASDTVPIQAGSVKKGVYIVLKGQPCKCVDVSTSKTGKHGHAKANIVGLDIFTGKKYEDVAPTSHTMYQPVVVRSEYQLIDIDAENFCSLMDDKGETREDLKLDPDNDPVHAKIKEDFDAGKHLTVVVLKAMKQEKIMQSKELND
ncbi:hypothetical protein CCYA_CCYA06G1845 [Cyanidiococcus yangmingshanensis]|uniref:Eukaryotic translation initiation factor 5A n=1 Tax=Cyanidiococcus yangmingshanensis TaxID=2690220 RepID=A0A7J7IKU8_9RHOD|nr:eukaryotic translation initiation factor [Cyanidiococcus yangmingshanensis]KAK4530988.1 hypothetical protein CCYA_CCYA06G1845 [Cyanidiococcus yangmingshanensis]